MAKKKKKVRARPAEAPAPTPLRSQAAGLRFGPDDIVRGIVMGEILKRPQRGTLSSPALGGAVTKKRPRPPSKAHPPRVDPRPQGEQPSVACVRCGKPLPAGARFCPYCRARQD